MRKLFWILFSVIIFSSCEKQNELFFPPEVGDVKLYGETAKTVYAESYIEDSKNIEVTECGFYVYPNDDKTNVRLVTAVLSNGMFSVKIDSLNPGTYYRIKAYARNAAGVGYSDSEKNCKTLFALAEISTNEVLEIRPTTAVCGGNISSSGGLPIMERGVCWSTSQNPTTNDAKTTDGTGMGNFTSNITGLTDGTTYYVRAYATNEMGTAYGEEKSFLTTSKPTVTTYPVTEISGTSAVCGGNVTSTGSSAIVARGVCWATHYNPTIEDDKTFDSVDTGSLFTSNITGLTEGTTYYVRAYATNGDGTSYGEERVFRTLSLPVVSTNAVTNISQGTAVCGGNVSSDGGVYIIARGVCWNTSPNPTISDSKTIDGSGSGSFTSNITGLASGTTYYVCAYATNSIGTAYGEVKQFTTEVPTTGTLNGHDWVDLGLPSRTKWATCNVGASTPNAYGNYYAWGETTPKSTYTSENYTHPTNETVLTSRFDVATTNWGVGWRMPTEAEIEELLNNCTNIWTIMNGVNGRLFTGSNGNSIFLPAAGNYYTNLDFANSKGSYWSSSHGNSKSFYALSLGFDSSYCELRGSVYYYGLTVRPVCTQ
ncbi:MAG: hypothetical protein J5542_04715 [Bacteroidales bacterium]|nr:hypothetical protein [Bacteroidales bacterium]